jgi:IS30 family transposase
MSSYRQLSLEESIRQIAAALDREPSTVSRELKRNTGAKIGYRPAYAQAQAEARRWSGCRLEREDGLRETIFDRLAAGWSPEQVAGRLAREAGYPVISHETIYRFVHAQLKRTNDRRWRHYLPRAKYKRGWRTKGGWPRPTGRTIHDRPPGIADRHEPGHWEADAMLFSRPGHALIVAHERTSRLTIAVRQDSLKAVPVASALVRMLRPVPVTLRRSINFDNGTEFTRHRQIERRLSLDTWFCDPRSPWQKGGVENAIGRLRRDLPRQTDAASLSPRKLDAILARYNHTSRKCLGFLTPAEALNPLHFDRESTPGSSPG